MRSRRSPLQKKKSAHSSFFVVGDAPAGGSEKTTAANDVLVTENGVSLKPGYGAFTNRFEMGSEDAESYMVLHAEELCDHASYNGTGATSGNTTGPPTDTRDSSFARKASATAPSSRPNAASRVSFGSSWFWWPCVPSSERKLTQERCSKEWFGQGRDRTLSCSLWPKPPKVNKHIARKLSGRSLHQAPPGPVKPDLR